MWLITTSGCFYVRPRKMKFNSLPGHVADAINVVVAEELVLSFPVRVAVSVQCFTYCKLK